MANSMETIKSCYYRAARAMTRCQESKKLHLLLLGTSANNSYLKNIHDWQRRRNSQRIVINGEKSEIRTLNLIRKTRGYASVFKGDDVTVLQLEVAILCQYLRRLSCSSFL